MDNIDIVFKAIELLYENDLIDLIEDEQTRKKYHRTVTDILIDTIRTHHRVDDLENTEYLTSRMPPKEQKIDDDWN